MNPAAKAYILLLLLLSLLKLNKYNLRSLFEKVVLNINYEMLIKINITALSFHFIKTTKAQFFFSKYLSMAA